MDIVVAPPPSPTTLGERIRAARKRRGKTQQDVADALGLARPSVLQWEKSITNPSLRNLQKFCDYLEIEIESVVGDDFIGRTIVHDPSDEDIARSTLKLIDRIRAVATTEIGFEPTRDQALKWLVKKGGIEDLI